VGESDLEEAGPLAAVALGLVAQPQDVRPDIVAEDATARHVRTDVRVLGVRAGTGVESLDQGEAGSL
jgi:hypothetical protein